MAKLAASEAATAISHQVSVRGAWARPQGLSASCPSPHQSFCVAGPAPVCPQKWESSPF